MPLYEYECETCAHRFELIQKFSDPPPAACPKCGAAVRKLLSSPAIQFKGSGFYLTDYGRGTGSKTDGAGSKGGQADTGGKAGSESGGESKSKSKSEGTSASSKGDSAPASAPKASTTDTSSGKSTPTKAD